MHGLAVVAALSLLIAACAYRGGDDPLTRKFTWFSYLNGDDLRARCVDAPGAPSRYRFVYNGSFRQQVRTYDIAPDVSGERYMLKVHVSGPSDLSSVEFNQPLTTLLDDPLDLLRPFGGTIDRVPMSARDLDALDRALAQSGFFRPAPVGLRLPSDGFYWIGIACVGGRVATNAYLWPSSRFADAEFPRLLLGWDPTGIPLNPARDMPFQNYEDGGATRGANVFTVTVDRDGIVTGPTPF